MFRGFVIFLLVLSVGVQTLPLRVCAVEQAIAGRSCHDHESAAIAELNDGRQGVDNGLDGHASTDGQSDQTCRCEMPKCGVDRHVPPDAPVDLLPAQASPLDLGLALANSVFVPAIDQPPIALAASVSLPLLI